MKRFHFLYLVLILVLSACGSGVGTSVGNPGTPKDQAFPSGLAVASPFEIADESTSSLSATILAQSSVLDGTYFAITDQINDIVDGTSAASCIFDPALFNTLAMDAECYGPSIAYENHPDFTGAPPPEPQADGVFPPGDLGFWLETDTTGHACAAAQLNARMESLRDLSLVGLSVAATAICTTTVNGLSLPSNSSLDLTSEMNALGISGITFNSASIMHSDASGTDVWTYNFDFTDTVVELTHLPGSSTEIYQGRLSIQRNATFNPAGNCPSTQQTRNTSLLYNRSSSTSLNTEMRSAQSCGSDTNNLSDGLVDLSNEYNNGANANGWANNASLFIANFNPNSLDGDYTMSWQAGNMDDATRVEIAHLETEGSTLEGSAFYGFGDSIGDTDGAITNFYCNWAGPDGAAFGGGLSQNLAQFQSMSFDNNTSLFDADTSSITYAPTNSCDSTAPFRYDTNADGTIDDPGTVTNDLIDLVDADGNGEFDAFENAGFSLPAAPANL